MTAVMHYTTPVLHHAARHRLRVKAERRRCSHSPGPQPNHALNAHCFRQQRQQRSALHAMYSTATPTFNMFRFHALSQAAAAAALSTFFLELNVEVITARSHTRPCTPA